MKVFTATLALLISSPAAAQECQTCSSADACIQTYLKAASEAQKSTKRLLIIYRIGFFRSGDSHGDLQLIESQGD